AGIPPVGALALRIVAMLEPDDRDLPRLQAPSAELRAGLRKLKEGREALEAGQAEAAVRAVRAALATPELAALGAAQAFLAEALNAARDPGAVAAAQRATEINPTLVDGWRELGDAQLGAGGLNAPDGAHRRRGETLPPRRRRGSRRAGVEADAARGGARAAGRAELNRNRALIPR